MLSQRFHVYAMVLQTRNKKAPNLPLVLGAPMDQERGTLIVVGVPPLSDTSCKK